MDLQTANKGGVVELGGVYDGVEPFPDGDCRVLSFLIRQNRAHLLEDGLIEKGEQHPRQSAVMLQ